MEVKLIVAFRVLEPRRSAEAYLATARALTEQAAAMGGRLTSWGATVCSFEFEEDSLVDAVELGISVALDSVPGAAFGVGLSEGRLERAEDATVGAALAWGPPLVRAIAMAHAARAGEVLVDETVGGVVRGEVLTRGVREVAYAGERFRGRLLDIKHPFRSGLAESVFSLDCPRFIGRSELGEMLIPAGQLAILRAEPGIGGSRFLAELEDALEPARVLTVAPHPMGEPLGAVRRAILRAVDLGRAPLAFSESVTHSLDSLLDGEGLDTDSAAELLASWLTPESRHDPSGALLLDDADALDVDTLEAIAAAARIAQDPFRVIARLGMNDPVPRALRALPGATEVRLGPLQEADAAKIAESCFRWEADPRTAICWASRGGGSPLGMVESLYDALESGELVWESGSVAPRLGPPRAVSPEAPRYWIGRRLGRLAADPRLVVTALAVLGGAAEVRQLQELIEERTDTPFEMAPTRALLESSGWVVPVEPDLLILTSATHRGAILASLQEDDFAAWHAAASSVLRRGPRPLASCAAAVHAVLSGNMDQAGELARRSAAATRAAGLERTADAFEVLAEHHEVGPLVERRLLALQIDIAREPAAVGAPDAATLERIEPEDILDEIEDVTFGDELTEILEIEDAEDILELGDEPGSGGVDILDEIAEVTRRERAALRAPPRPPDAAAPVAPPEALEPPEGPVGAPSTGSAEPGAPLADAPAEPLPESDEDRPTRAFQRPSVPVDPPLPEPSPEPPRIEEVSPSPSPPPSALVQQEAVAALRTGDPRAVDELAERLRVDDERPELAERLSAMASLARGDSGEALRRLRNAAEEARQGRTAEQCRTQLALAVGLARVERADEALLTALRGLARAREKGDGRGEQACVRFIAQLCRGAGQEALADVWQSIAR
jgi:hypothetical protein